jgi:hypothetical protein
MLNATACADDLKSNFPRQAHMVGEKFCLIFERGDALRLRITDDNVVKSSS